MLKLQKIVLICLLFGNSAGRILADEVKAPELIKKKHQPSCTKKRTKQAEEKFWVADAKEVIWRLVQVGSIVGLVSSNLYYYNQAQTGKGVINILSSLAGNDDIVILTKNSNKLNLNQVVSNLMVLVPYLSFKITKYNQGRHEGIFLDVRH